MTTSTGHRPRRTAIGLLGLLLIAGCAVGGSAQHSAALVRLSAGSGFGPQECGTYSGTGCAPRSKRVDLERPTFSHPAHITNPLFPISRLASVVFLGREDGHGFRSETTLLPRTRTVIWDGQRIQTLASQYAAWRDGRIEEVALDRYAQADDGSVWYFGEDVVDYKDGHIVTTEGTWLAGKEGPPAMIMPAHPRVGDAFRTENVPGIVFEEITVKRVGQTVPGPDGPVHGAMIGSELHLDRTRETKTFAPGYGEFLTGHGANVEALALAVPVNSRSGPTPVPLVSLATSASGMLGSLQTGDRLAVTTTLKRMNAAWRTLRGPHQPPLIAAQVTRSLTALARAVRTRKTIDAEQAAIDTHRSVLDLELQYRPSAEVSRDRFELWAHQVLLDAAAHDSAGVSGDVATLEWIRDRITATVTSADLATLDGTLRALGAAADNHRLGAASDYAARLIGELRNSVPPVSSGT
jgi:hypothetical protein